MVHRSDVGLSPFQGPGDAEQSHQVRVVCMEELAVKISAHKNYPGICHGLTVRLSGKS